MMKTNKRCSSFSIAMVLTIIGGINWGLVGLGYFLGGINLNLVNLLTGSIPVLEAIIYLVIGIAAIVMIFGCRCSSCSTGSVCASGASCDSCATCSKGSHCSSCNAKDSK